MKFEIITDDIALLKFACTMLASTVALYEQPYLDSVEEADVIRILKEYGLKTVEIRCKNCTSIRTLKCADGTTSQCCTLFESEGYVHELEYDQDKCEMFEFDKREVKLK